MPKYTHPPMITQWLKDTAPTPGRVAPPRSADPILMRIDEILSAYQATHDDGQKWWLINDLFFCTDYWLKRQSQGASRLMDAGRQPAVFALFAASAEWLCKLFSCTINVLPRELEKAFGREMGAHGTEVDSRPKVRLYLQRATTEKYRILWRDGKAWQMPWWKGSSKKVVLAESSRSPGKYDPKCGITGAMFDKGFSGYVMSMGRDLYLAPHFGGFEEDNFFHSSYLRGTAVLCAGSILIEAGVVKEIRTDSGHYRPTAEHLTNMLLALKMVGVSLAGITCRYYEGGGTKAMTAEALLAAKGNWGRIDAGKKQFESHLQARKLGLN